MEPVKIIQPSFVAGELSPAMAGRVDVAKYRAGAALLENFIVQPQGGVINRPGFQFIAALPEPVRLVPFQFSISQSYILCFGDCTLYVIKQGGVVVGPGAAAVIATPYAYADVLAIDCKAQSADTLFLAHPSYPPYQLQRSSDVDWTFTPLTFSVATRSPTGLTATYLHGAPKAGTTLGIEYQVSAIGANGEESLPCPAVSVTVDYPWYATGLVELNWDQMPGAVQYKVYKNSRGYFGLVGVLTSNSAKIANGTAITNGSAGGNAAANAFDGDWDTAWEGLHEGGASNGVDYIGQDFGTAQTVTGFRITQGSKGPISGPTSIRLDSSDDGNLWVVGQVFALLRGLNLWQQFTLTTPVTARYFRLIRVSNGDHWFVGELEFQGTGLSNQFTDDNINEDTSNGSQTTQNAFPGPGDYPGAVGLYQQRLFLAGSNNNPSMIWATQTGLYNNMGVSFPLKATDSLKFALMAQGVNAIKFLLPLNNLLVFTGDAEWVVGPGSNADGITPTAVAANLQGYRGCANLHPLAIGRCVLFVQRNGTVVREMDYSSYFSLFTSLFAPTIDVSIFANHLFDGHSLIEWAYQQTPYYAIWAVRDDGVLLGFTYIKEQQITAWHHHTTNGLFLSVASIDEGHGQTELYVLVQRTVQGVAKYYVERMYHRIPLTSAVFLDAALTYNGAPAKVFTGLDHLEGCDVGIVADGSVVPSQVVTGGRVTLHEAASIVAVGLAYTSSLQTMKLEQEMQGGTLQGRLGTIPRLVTRFLDSRGGWIGPNATDLVEIPYRDGEDYNEATALFTGDLINPIASDWQRGFRVYVQQRDPLPMNLLAVVPEILPGET